MIKIVALFSYQVFNLKTLGIGLVSGYVLWSFTEYILHRYTFHFNPINFPWSYLTFGLHAHHHKNPDEQAYTPVPLVLSFPIYAIIVGSLLLFFQEGLLGLSISIFFGVFYILFELYHYRCHEDDAKDWLTNIIRDYHFKHHFVSTKVNYGVMSCLGDLVFGTKHR